MSLLAEWAAHDRYRQWCCTWGAIGWAHVLVERGAPRWMLESFGDYVRMAQHFDELAHSSERATSKRAA